MPNSNSFFVDDADPDSAYDAVRTAPHLQHARVLIESLWEKFRPLSDAHFQSDALKHFHQRFWEMYLACALIDNGIDLKRHGGAGPDFYFEKNNKRVWVEAVAPTRGEGPDRVPKPSYGVSVSVPTKKVTLRIISAIHDKHRKMEADVDKGIIGPDDAVILAINIHQIPHAYVGRTVPYILKAVFPIGPLSVSIDRTSGTVIDSIHAYEPSLSKASGSSVSKEIFLDPRYSRISAVISSGVDCVNSPQRIGGDFLVVHNPNAAHCMPISTFAWSKQSRCEDGQIIDIEPEV